MGPRWIGHVRLLRLPLAATTIADIWVGYVIAHSALGPLGGGAPPFDVAELLRLHAVALCLYGAGMTLNDAFDAKRDRALHPSRPIPAGWVSRRAAFVQGGALLAAALLLAAWHGGATLLVAGFMALGILAYDALLKRWPVPGAIAMGFVRYLDVQLGAGLLLGPAFSPAIVLGLYVAALTWLSQFEERPREGRGITLGMGAVVVVLMAGGLRLPHYLRASWLYALAAAAVCFMGMRAVHLQSRGSVKRLVLVGLLAMYAIHAGSLMGFGLWPWDMATLALAGSFPPLVRLQSSLAAASAGTETRRSGQQEDESA